MNRAYIGLHRPETVRKVGPDWWPTARRPADAPTAVIPAVRPDTAEVLAELRNDLNHPHLEEQ
ncbi:hypothetical protein E1091_17665 [Micromonospora fluostatini]|uniref:Uncharacterized protein n=1 Tax=Micromonospora fluostatini TaxID=1629071 RepID=A0ABY2DFS0_9ACTN|nr:hypothetical protein E1091_17665 [Micromonospora fluostatini]